MALPRLTETEINALIAQAAG
jgi:hypothetical protein